MGASPPMTGRRFQPKLLALAALALASAALVAVGCGGSEESASMQAPEAAASGAGQPGKSASGGSEGAGGIPGPLADNRAEANEIVEGGTAALDDKLAELRGFPVVVNQWGSWCPPCREELPWFADAADEHAADVAFLGIDMNDDLDAAADFLEQHPIPFPSVFDPDAEATISLGGGQGSPTTFFIDPEGEVIHVRPGVYPGPEELEDDIQRYAVAGS